MKRVAVFASGGGSNFQALMEQRDAGRLHVDFVLVIGNNSKAAALERARSRGIPAVHVAPSHFADPADYEHRLSVLLEEHKVDIVVLAGYMRKLPPMIVQFYRNQILNIHPALLPAFGGPGMYGHHVHEAVIKSGAKLTGVTVHFVDEEYDHGPVILQEPVRVLDSDTAETLAQRVLEVEHSSYWRALEAVAQGRLKVDGRRVLGEV